jgi:hypothetical protein
LHRKGGENEYSLYGIIQSPEKEAIRTGKLLVEKATDSLGLWVNVCTGSGISICLPYSTSHCSCNLFYDKWNYKH